MPRPKNYVLHSLFDISDDGNRTVCHHGNCNGKVYSSHSANLERHLKHVHPELYVNYLEQKSDTTSNIKIQLSKPLKAKITPDNNLNRANIELAIVDFFTRNGVNMVKDRALQILFQPAFDALDGGDDGGISMDEECINERIIEFYEKWKTDVINEMKGKLLSLKIDAATGQDLRILGINVQYIANKCIQVKTLAVKELKSSYTSEQLKSLILEVLREYEIDVEQIFTITTARGANDINADLHLSGVDKSLVFSTAEEFIDVDDDDDDSLTADQMELILQSFSSDHITAVRWGAHSLELCVQEAIIERLDIKQQLDKCKCFAKMLKTQTNLKNPTTSAAASCNSTIDMLEYLLQVKDLIDPLTTDNLSAEDWNFVSEFTDTFKPIHTAITKLQSQQLCISELYIIIMDTLFQIEGLPGSKMKSMLSNALNECKAELFESDLFNAAIFLDPRIKICLNAAQEERAKNYINCLNKRMTTLKEPAAETMDILIKEEILEETPSSSNRFSATSFSEFLLNLDHGGPKSSSINPDLETDFVIYKRQPRLPLDLNLIDYWSVQNTCLSAIADTILAIPSTRVSLGRLYSALRHILSDDQRNRLSTFEGEHALVVQINGVFNNKD